MKFHDELNPKLWDKNNEEYTLKEEVKAKLEEIATAFIEYLDIPADAILDKVITGSSASYNYTEFSDLDLHIIVDFDKVHKDCPVVEGYLSAMKSTFNKEHDIFIHAVPVELYAEKKDQGTVHNGLYSLQTGWIDIPNKIEPTDNDAAVEAKYNELKELIDKCETAEVADELLDKIYTMRKAGLADAGEFSTENLAFKKLRNEGVMNKLRQLKKQEVDKQLSLESYNEGFRKLSKAEQEIEKILNDNGFKPSAIETQKGEYVKLYYIDKEEILTGNQISDKYVEGKDFKEVLKKVKELFGKNESVNESTKKYRSVVADGKYTRYKDFFGTRGRKRTLHVKATGETKQFLSGPKREYKDIKTGQLFYLGDDSDVMTDIMGEPYTKFEIISESFKKALIKESLKDEYKQAFDLLVEGENIVATLDTDFGKQFVKDVENLYKIKSYRLKLSIAKEMLKDIKGYLVDEQYDNYNAKIDKFINNSKNESIREEIGEFSTVTDFNSPQEFKQDLEKYRKEYEVIDQIEGKDLLHLVYDNGKHIATFNNTKLQKYSESVNEDYEWHGPVAKVTFDNGEVITTCINGTDEEIKSYYMGKTFNLGREEDDMHKVVKVEVIRESVEDVHSNFKSMAKRIVRDFKVKGYPKSNKFYMDFAKEAVEGFKKDWGHDVKISTGNGELILTLEDTYQAVIDAQTHKIKFSDLENSNYMFENKKEEREMKHKNEGMWASPFTVKNAKKVAKLLANPITLGELNSQEKQKELWNVIGDDQFWDDVIEEATAEPDCDARPLIISNLEHWIENKENFNDDAYYQAAEDIITKAIAKFDKNLKKLTESKNIYKPSTILKALDIERNWYKEIGLSSDEKAPQVMLFIIDNDEIKDTKLVDRQDVYTYKPQANEYYLDRLRDTGFDLTDYNLSHVQKMVDSWNEGKKFEDVDSLCDKIDNANSDLQLLIKSLAPAKNPVVESINKCLAEALEEEIWGVEMFLDTVDGDPEPGHVEFTRDSLIDFLNDYGYELSKDASDEEIKECAEDYEMTIKYIRRPN